jgi:hypothetical protein
MFIHVTAGFGDVGFAGFWTLEIFCMYNPSGFTQTSKYAKSIITIYWANTTAIKAENTRTTKAYSPVCCLRILRNRRKSLVISH